MSTKCPVITMKEVSLTKEVLEEIRRIDLEFYPHIGPIDWYLARYKPWHSAFVAMDDERIVGYFVAVPIQKGLYDAVLNGVLVDDLGVNPAMFLKESEYYYAVSIVIEKAYRGQKISRRLLDMFIDRHRDKKTCLIAISPEGCRLAEQYFKYKENLSDTVRVFVSE